MKHVILAIMLMAPVTANASTGPDIPSAVAQLRCTWLTLQQAARGDFSQWVLPDLVPSRHLQAGELPDCLRMHGPTGSAPYPSQDPGVRSSADEDPR